jgi:hypothetical protein
MSETPQPNEEPQKELESPEPKIEEELSSEEIERIAMEKVVDIRFSDRNLYVHNPGYGREYSGGLLTGLLNSEKILRLGLITKAIEKRTGIKKNRGTGTPKENLVYVAKNDFITFSHVKGWYFLLKLGDQVISREKRDDHAYDIPVKGRIKPKNLIGLIIPDDLVNKDIEKVLRESTDNKNVLVAQLIQAIKDMKINISSEDEDLLNKIGNLLDDLIGKKTNIVKPINDPVREHEVNENFQKAVDIFLSCIKGEEKFKNIKTFGDFLTKLGTQFEIPIYAQSGDLIFPQEMNSEELEKFVEERGKDKN